MDIDVKVNQNYAEHQTTSGGKWEKGNDPVYKEYRRKWNDNPKAFLLEKGGGGPLHIDAEVTSACNLRCPMCTRTVEVEKKNFTVGFMDIELYKKVIDEAAALGTYSVKYNWRGEPLLHPQLVEMVQYAKSKGMIDIMFNTNAVLLTPELSEKLIAAGLDKIFFSVDSIKKERYEKYRPGAVYEDVMENIRKFKEINDSNGHKVMTRVSKVLLNETADEKEEYEKIFSSLVDTIGYDTYIPHAEENYGKNIDISEKAISFACSQLWQRLFISWDGKAYMCCADDKEKHPVGNANIQSIEEIWNGKAINTVREAHMQQKWADIDVCKNCFLPHI